MADRILSPEEVAYRARYGQDTLQGGRQMAQAPRHWAQALAGALQMGLGGHYGANAAFQEKEGKASANKMLADALMGGAAPKDVAAQMMANPWAADTGRALAVRELDPMTALQRQKAQLMIDNARADAALNPLRRQKLEMEIGAARSAQEQSNMFRDMVRDVYGPQGGSAPMPAQEAPSTGVARFAAPQLARPEQNDLVQVGNRQMSRDQAKQFAERLMLNPDTAKMGKALLDRVNLASASNMGFGEKQVDKEFAKDYNEFVAQGGFADMRKNIKQLRLVGDELKQGKKNLTGPLVGALPDAVNAYINPDAVDRRELVEEVVQRNLRLILGAQFTQREGDRLIARAYNPLLDEKTNAQRLDRLIGAMEKAAAAKMEAAQYFEQNGTLKGYRGTKNFTVDDIISSAGLDDGPAKPSATGLSSGVYNFNPETGEFEAE